MQSDRAQAGPNYTDSDAVTEALHHVSSTQKVRLIHQCFQADTVIFSFDQAIPLDSMGIAM